MSLSPNLRAGLISGLLPGLNAVGQAEPCVQAAALVSSAVANVNFPINAADFATKCGVPAMTPSFIWDCQEPSLALVDAIANEILLPYPFFATSPAYSVATSGLEGGARTAIQLDDDTAQAFQSDNTDMLDPINGAVAFFAVFKCGSSGLSRAFLSKGPGLTIGSTDELETGFKGTFDSSGRINAGISDGVTGYAVSLVAPDLCDAGWHIAGIAFDDVAETVRTMNESGQHSRSVSGISLINNHSYFALGRGVNASNAQAPALDVTYIIGFEGAAARACTVAGLSTFLTQAVT